jgi:hypothetical protein
MIKLAVQSKKKKPYVEIKFAVCPSISNLVLATKPYLLQGWTTKLPSNHKFCEKLA